MFHKDPTFILIEKQEDLEKFYKENAGCSWMSFDSEFVGEKRFHTRLCLIQCATPNGIFLIDPFPLSDLSPFLQMLENPAMTKITHAGDNDYRLLNAQYGTVPRNLFDTQIAAGFVGYKFPASFRMLVENELGISLKKGYTVADWESRPFNAKQLRYAIEDIVPLFDIWKSLEAKLIKYNRMDWAREEFSQMEKEGFYEKDPNSEALNSRLMQSLKPKEQLFLLRLLEWRRKLAQEKNHSREMVLPGKLIPHIVRAIPSGRDALFQNRRLPDRIASEYGQIFEELYRKKGTDEERDLLRQIPQDEENNPQEELYVEMLYLIVRQRSMEQGVSPNLVFAKNMIRKLQTEPDLAEELLDKSWRGALLGKELVRWLRFPAELEVEMKKDTILLSRKPR